MRGQTGRLSGQLAAARGSRAGRNLRSDLKTRRRSLSPMQAFDALPPELRRWLSTACLPWSAASVLKIWNREGGSANREAAISKLDAIERSMLRKDKRIWRASRTQ